MSLFAGLRRSQNQQRPQECRNYGERAVRPVNFNVIVEFHS